ncbi:MAG: GNAT family N-acetyltransferase [Bauldia sp.]
MSGLPLETERLILRNWREEDSAPFAALNADARVMEFFPRALFREESGALLARQRSAIAETGIGLYAIEEKGSSKFLGFAGLAPVAFAAPFAPATQIAWRLAREAWGSGYATEAVQAVIAHAFGTLGLSELVAFTTEWNKRSRRVMEKVGMVRDEGGDFLHPDLPPDHTLARHVLYRIPRGRGPQEDSAAGSVSTRPRRKPT